ncbi:MAG: cupin domain-containing protein [Steroidobacteraceae bacterium]
MTMRIRRIVTGVDARGAAVVVHDGTALHTVSRPAMSVESTLLWVTDETPVDLAKRGDPANREIGVAPPAGGSILRVVDFLPDPNRKLDNAGFLAEMGLAHGAASGAPAARHPFMHRTKSIDYAIVLQGEIDMLLDEGEVHVSAGDFLIQRGTNHAWVNRSNALCRIAFILIDARDFPPPDGAPFPSP